MRPRKKKRFLVLSQLDMFFKYLALEFRDYFRWVISNFLLLTAFCLLLTVSGLPEIIDRIIAVVNDQVITLSDIRIAETFGLYENINAESEENLHQQILEKLIDQKLIIQLMGERVSVEEEELEAELERITEKIGSYEVQKRLVQFGLDRNVLKEYLHEKLLYQKILSRRFSQSVIVSLKEIESYYIQNYVPSQRAKGFEPKPMVELLDKIESTIKQKKIENKVLEWIKNLRQEADIQIKIK